MVTPENVEKILGEWQDAIDPMQAAIACTIDASSAMMRHEEGDRSEDWEQVATRSFYFASAWATVSIALQLQRVADGLDERNNLLRQASEDARQRSEELDRHYKQLRDLLERWDDPETIQPEGESAE